MKKLLFFILNATKVALGNSINISRLAFLIIVITIGFSASAGTITYCASAKASTSHSGTYSLNFTCRYVSGTTYQMVLDFPNAVTSADNMNIGANPGPVSVTAGGAVWTNANKTLTYTFSTTSAPTLYVATIFVTISGVQVRWDLPLDGNFAVTCASTAPALTSTAATAIGSTTATMNGNISSNGGASITSYGFYWSTTTGFANGAGTQVVTGSTNVTGAISSNLTGLTNATIYYYKAYATNSVGTTYGTQQSFTTTPLPVLAATTAASAILSTTATSGGNVTDIGTSPVTAKGVCWGTTTAPTIALATKTNDGTGSGTFTSSLTGLTASTLYYVRAYATNTSGTSYGAEVTFTSAAPALTAAPTPTRLAANVISIFSDAYTNLAGTNFAPGWGQTTAVADNPIGGNATKKYTNFNYIGIQLAGPPYPSPSVSGMTMLHVDVYPTTSQTIRLTPIHSPSGETPTSLGTLIPNQWNSFDIALSVYTGVIMTDIFQFKFDGGAGGTFYMDNLYFYKPVTAPGAPTAAVATRGNTSASVAFTAPASTGGSAITGYTVTSSPGGFTATGASSPLTVTGLTNGTSYTFTVTATNAVGTSAASAASAAVTPATVPGAPTATVATLGNASASVAFTAPASTGGSAITSYTITSSPGSFISTGASSPLNITGLTNGTSYTFTVTATNAVGTGSASTATTAVTPATIPGAPTIVTITPDDSQLSISFTEGTTGGSTITNYKYSTNGGSSFTACSPIQTTSPIVITGLTNGIAYNIQIRAVNAIGDGTATGSTSATPSIAAIAPSAPTISVITPSSGQLSVAFTAGSNGGSAITNYKYSSDNGATFTACSPSQTTSPIVISGLTNGTSYTIQIKAVNAVGDGTATASIAAMPASVPDAPTIGTATYGNTTASVTFTAPGSNGGSAITGYTVTSSPSGLTLNGASSPIVFTGLTNGTIYSFTVTATNSIGTSAASSASNQVTPATAPTLGTFTVPAKLTTDPAFTLTAPTTNSAGAFTYTIDNAAVATISGSTVTIVGVGTATITATQDANGAYLSGSTTASLVVTYPAPTFNPFTVSAKAIGDSDFTLNGATSNSAGVITYTSGNTAVATIIGTTVHIVGVGTSVITATQAAYGSYISGSTTASFVVSYPAAPVPTRLQENVVSVFSNTYTPAFGTVTYSTTTDATLAGNATKLCTNLAYAQATFTTSAAAASMTFLHVDIYNTAGLSSMRIQVGSSFSGFFSTPAGTWTSLDIPVATFVNFNSINLINIQNGTGSGSTFYFDNIYFWKPAPIAPTFGAFTVPAKLTTDTAFTLTAPTTNSAGAFTYTSGNEAVATISGSTVTIVGVGTSIITATQAANGAYLSGSTTASFVVSYPPPTFNAFTVPGKLSTDSDFTLNGATSNSAGAFTYTSGNEAVATISGTTVHIVGAGTSVITATQAANGLYSSGSTTASFVVTSALPAPTFDAFTIAGKLSTDSDFTLNGATSNSAGAFTYTSGNTAVATIIGTTVHIEGAGTSVITATQDTDGTYRSGSTTASFVVTYVAPTTTTLGVFTVPAKLTTSPPFTLTPPTTNSNVAFTYSSSNTAVATISGTTVTIVGLGTSIITANQAASLSFSAASTTASLVVTMPAAPTPPVRNSWDVVSVFSGAYTPAAGTREYNPNWGQSGYANFAQPLIDGDMVNKYSGVNYQGINIGTATNVTAMTTVHIDIWSTDCASTDFRIIDTTDRSKILTTTTGQWTSFDILLSDFGGLDKTNINQFKFQRNPFGASSEWYIDNIYFYRAATFAAPTFGTFTIPSKVLGDADFDLTAPSSPSAGAITYTSGNQAVATISGATVTIVGSGTSIITATQAANGYYLSGSTTASLLVSAAPVTPTVLGAFADLTKVTTDAAFSLTPPTTNSDVAFTYSSSNTAVATVSGSTVTIVGVGTTTITATQAASLSYSLASTTASLVVSVPVPMIAPTTPPTRNVWDLKSIYSGAYTNQPGVTFSDFDGAGGVISDYTLPDISVVKKYLGHSYSGIQVIPTTGLDVATLSSGMTTLHMDVWSYNFTSLNIKLEAFNGSNTELGVPGGTSQGTWKSYDIPLSGYSAVDLAHLKYIVPVTYGQNATLYITNVYFYRASTTLQPTFTQVSTVCSGAMLAALPLVSNNVTPITGTWSPAIDNTATTLYTFTPTPGLDAYTATMTISVDAPTVAGTVSENQVIYSGATPANITLSGNTGSVVKWQSASDSEFTSPTDIAITSTTLTGLNIGSLSTTTYFRAVVQNGSCLEAYSNVVTVSMSDVKTWTGGSSAVWTLAENWSGNSMPTSASDVTIASGLQPIITTDITIHSLTIQTGMTVTVATGSDLTVTDVITNVGTGTMIVQNNANLIQTNPLAINTGNITVVRNSAPLLRLDHTLWSSPVTVNTLELGFQTLQSFSPATLANRFYTYTTSSNSYTGTPGSSVFTAGKGYAIRASNLQSAATASPFEGSFIGVPNNGNKTFTLATTSANNLFDYNLVGNPYPSTIDIAEFLAENQNVVGTIYFYSHSLTMNASGVFPQTLELNGGGSNYSKRNGLGGVAATTENVLFGVHAAPTTPSSSTIQVGQGFLVRSKTPLEGTGGGNITFTNAMRRDFTGTNNSTPFMRTTSVEKHRIWLNLKTASGIDINQMLVGYIEGATQAVDFNFDGLDFGSAGSSLSSKIEGSNYCIQGRSLPFASNDIVPLAFKASAVGNYTISLTNTDGLFAENQDIFVRDNLIGIDHNIKVSPYSFSSEVGTFDSRFKLVYTQALGIPSTDFTPNSVIVYKNTDWFHVSTKGIIMKDIQVYDVSGRLLYKLSDINAPTAELRGLTQTNEVLFLKITSADNGMVTVKVIN